MSKNLVIKLNRPSGFVLPACSKGADVEEVSGKMLLPGENSISEVCWNEVQKNPGVVIALRANVLQNMGAGEASPLVNDWNGITLPKAAAVLSQISDPLVIQKIKQSAKKKGLADLCDKRVEELLDENEKKNA